MTIRILMVIAGCIAGVAHAQQYKIKVHVIGHDGKPMQESHASLTQNKIDSQIEIPASSVQDNTFEFSVNAPGLYFVRCAGTHHRAVRCPILIEQDELIEFEVRLGTLKKEMKTPDSVFVSGSFNDFSLDKRLQKMTRQKNGAYIASIPSERTKILSYRPLLFMDGDGIPVDAPGKTNYKYDSNRYTNWLGGSYYAVINTHTKQTKLTFDPGLLLASDLPALVNFSNPRSTTAKLLTAHLAVDFRKMKFRLASYNFLDTRQLGNYEDFIRAYNIEEDLSYFSAMATAATDQTSKDVYQMAAFYAEVDSSSQARKVLKTISPDSRVWKIGSPWVLDAFPDPKEAAYFAEKIAAAQDDESLRADYLVFALDVYHKEGDEKNFVRLYNDFMKEFAAYPKWLEGIKKRNPLNRKIAIGKVMPDFSFVSLDDPDHVITPGELRGKTYLIDLWATWCSPCVAEMKNLHQVYEQFKDKGFTIVSISFDDSPEVVANFRQKKWNMPWYNAFAGRYGGEKSNQIFEQQGLPRAILVDAKGIIVAIDDQIKGEKLAQVLQHLLKK
ncbi:MAG: TlpA disulfide reductase family protein [Cyclobacteriaceae bacterium]